MPFSVIDPFFWPVSAEPHSSRKLCSSSLRSNRHDDNNDFWNVPKTISIYWPTLNGALESIYNNEDDRQIRDLERKLSSSFGIFGNNNDQSEDNSSFKFTCDASDYQPGEIYIKIEGEELVITGEHKKEDKHQSVHRSFTRRVSLPKTIKKETIECNVDSKGRLNVVAELIKPKEEKPKTIKIPIKFVGDRSIEIEKTKEAATTNLGEEKTKEDNKEVNKKEEEKKK